MKPFAKIDIRAATAEDLPQMTHIWQVVFGDSDEYIRFFFENRCALSDALLLTVQDEIVSQLFLLPASVRCGTQSFSVFYLFAAATLPSHRGCGYMGDLIRAAQQNCRSERVDGIVLLPAEESLYGYYARFGFETAFSRKIWHGARAQLQALSNPAALDKTNAAEFLWRSQQTRDGVVWSRPALDYALREQAQFRGDYTVADGCAFAAADDVCTVFSSPEQFPKGVYALLSLTADSELSLVLPPDAPIGTEQKGGMLWSATRQIPLKKALLTFSMQ